jgi:hypothetical protein
MRAKIDLDYEQVREAIYLYMKGKGLSALSLTITFNLSIDRGEYGGSDIPVLLGATVETEVGQE